MASTIVIILLLVQPVISAALLSPANYYKFSCPGVESMVRVSVEKAINAEPRMAASLLRLHFHDCFVQGCDASILLDNTPTFVGEKTAPPNDHSARGFNVIDGIKAEIESKCPGMVSCADVLAMAARDAVFLSGGPLWTIELGRLDSLSANRSLTANLPGPGSNASTLVASFGKLGLKTRDMVALSGAHTIGKARCATFRSRLTPVSATANALPPCIDPGFQKTLDRFCSSNDLSALADLEPSSPAKFDNNYYKNLLAGSGLLPSDMALVAAPGEIAELVKTYANDEAKFFTDFKRAMLYMGRLAPPQGSGGEIRRNCRKANSGS